MLNTTELKEALQKNINWFQNSGIMDPADGSWGVAERLVLTEGNDALDHTFSSFPAYSVYDKHAVIEHRRPDCNFETALMFLLAADVYDKQEYRDTAVNILHFLYRRSGMWNTKYPGFPLNTWRWANEKWVPVVWFDDNAWDCVIPLIIGKMCPELEKRFNMKETSLLLADQMVDAFNRQFPAGQPRGDRYEWAGQLESPHWGSLVCMAMAYAYAETKDDKFKAAINRYDAYLNENLDSFTTSEQAYIVIGSANAAQLLNCEASKATAKKAADTLLSKQNQESGNIPSEWSREAPTGEHLVDTIYTQNWALLGLKYIQNISDEEKYRTAFEKALNLLVDIQDDCQDSILAGCWRGMYDMNAKSWGGGNRYEGGADSIYSGWTNAPISIVIALELLGKNL